MPQLFPRGANALLQWTLIGIPAAALGAVALSVAMVRSPWVTGEGIVVAQPVPFSHERHVGALGLDCRYCHASVERSAFADIPPSETCMSCHSQIWTQADMLAPVRESWRTGEVLPWVRVHDLPDFVFFNHSAHVNKGVACVTCHGRVDRMPLMAKEKPLHMSWCMDCHRDPAPNLRSRETVFSMDAPAPPDGEAARRQGLEFLRRYRVDVRNLNDCTRCHR